MIKRGRKAQFFLIASLIIVTILTSFVTYRNYIKIPPVKYKVYDMGKELNIGTAEIIDFGIYSEQSQLDKYVEEWAKNFSFYGETGRKSFILIYTDQSGGVRNRVYAERNQGGMRVSTSEGSSGISVSNAEGSAVNIPTGGKGRIKIGDVSLDISYNTNDKFYYAVVGEEGEVAQK